jgi:hypothetical protein
VGPTAETLLASLMQEHRETAGRALVHMLQHAAAAAAAAPDSDEVRGRGGGSMRGAGGGCSARAGGLGPCSGFVVTRARRV